MAGQPARSPQSRVPPPRKPGERRRRSVLNPGDHELNPQQLRVMEFDDDTDDTPATAVPSAFLITLASDDEDDQDEVATMHIDRAAVEEAERRRRLAPPPAPEERHWLDMAAAPLFDESQAPAPRALERVIAFTLITLAVIGTLAVLLN